MTKKGFLLVLLVICWCLAVRPVDYWTALFLSDTASNVLSSLDSLIGVIGALYLAFNIK